MTTPPRSPEPIDLTTPPESLEPIDLITLPETAVPLQHFASIQQPAVFLQQPAFIQPQDAPGKSNSPFTVKEILEYKDKNEHRWLIGLCFCLMLTVFFSTLALIGFTVAHWSTYKQEQCFKNLNYLRALDNLSDQQLEHLQETSEAEKVKFIGNKRLE